MSKAIHGTTVKDVLVLEALAEDDFRPRTITELCEVTKLNRDAVYAALVTWESIGYVRRKGDLYQIGARLAMLANQRLETMQNS